MMAQNVSLHRLKCFGIFLTPNLPHHAMKISIRCVVSLDRFEK